MLCVHAVGGGNISSRPVSKTTTTGAAGSSLNLLEGITASGSLADGGTSPADAAATRRRRRPSLVRDPKK